MAGALPHGDRPRPLDQDSHRAPREEAATPSAGRGPGGSRRWAIAVVLAGLLAVPFLTAAVVTRTPRWFPTHDIALLELKVRDVWSAHPPLIGLAGRFGELGPGQGSHPGPLAFYVMAVPHALLGGSAWALQAATLLLQIAAAAAVVWLAWRRGGPAVALGLAAAVAVLAHAYGAEALAQPWLPYLPVLWFVAFLLAVWSVADGDLLPLPVVVLSGSLCVQTHISYGLTVGAGLAVAAGATAWWLRARRRAPGPARDRNAAVLAVVAGVLVWLPPVLEQLGGGRGNLSILVDDFRHPDEAVVGAREGLDLLLVLLDPWRLLSNSAPIGGFPTTGSLVPGVVLLVVWVVAVLGAWRLRHVRLLRLHGVLAVALLAAGLSLGRIIGTPHNYLTLWVWAISALLLVAIGWTVAAAVEASGVVRPAARRTTLGVGAAALAVVTVAYVADLTAEAARSPVADADLSERVAGVIGPTVDRLDRGDVPGGGREGSYLVTWTDPVHSVAQPSFGFFDELEREGFDVGVLEYYQVPFPHRVQDLDEATGEIHFSVGADIRTWRARGDAVEVASFDPRDDDEQAEFTSIEEELADELRQAGNADLAGQVADVAPLFGAPSLTTDQRLALGRLVELGVPVAVFVAPPP